jgi:hypothetical protein
MEIKTEKDINGKVCAALREQLGETQKVFWNMVGITQSGGCRYESGAPIQKPVRTLVFMRCIAGIDIDASTEQGAKSLIRAGKLQASERAEEKEKIGEHVQVALKHVKSASHALAKV